MTLINLLPEVLKKAREKIGVTDHGINDTDFNSWADKHYPRQNQPWKGEPWCYIFVSWALIISGVHVPFFSYVPSGYLYYKAKGKLSKVPKEGDIAFYCWNEDSFLADNSHGIPQHVGIVTKVNPDGSFQAIEGNTSSGHVGSQDNGDGIYEKTRHLSDVKAFGIQDYMQ